MKKHDPDKILFASDYPMGNPMEELDFLKRLNLGSDMMDKILYKNAQRLLGI
jgi:predicted TIM-barrel fold metal-dependent hydrolase